MKKKSKKLKDTNQVLDACRKEWQKLYHENEALKKKITKLQKKLSKYQSKTMKKIAKNKIARYWIQWGKN